MPRALSYLLVLLMLGGCAAPRVHEHLFTERKFAPTTQVETLISWPKDRKYQKIAEFEITEGIAHSDRAILEAFVEKAKAMGADAIVWGARPGQGSTQVPVVGPVDMSVNVDVKNRAVAIKYLP